MNWKINFNINDIIVRKDWKFLIRNFLPVNIADSFSFSEGMKIVGNLTKAAADEIVRDGFIADLMRDFTVNLMIILRAKYTKEWEEDWKNEAFLGISCASVYREEEAFHYIKSAYEKLDDPPQSLLLAYINSGRSSDHFLTKEEIVHLTERALQKGVTYETASRMAFLASDEGNQKKCNYWEQAALEAEAKKLHTPFIIPNVLKKIVEVENGYQYED